MLKEIRNYYMHEKLDECYFVDENNLRQGLYQEYHLNGNLFRKKVYKNNMAHNISICYQNFNNIKYMVTCKLHTHHGMLIVFE